MDLRAGGLNWNAAHVRLQVWNWTALLAVEASCCVPSSIARPVQATAGFVAQDANIPRSIARAQAGKAGPFAQQSGAVHEANWFAEMGKTDGPIRSK
jgi:hypothetical protein